MARCACFCDESGCDKCCYCGRSFAERDSNRLPDDLRKILEECYSRVMDTAYSKDDYEFAEKISKLL